MAKKEELTGRFSSWASHAVAQSQLGIALLLLPLLACVVLWGSFRARAPIAGGWGEDAQTGSQADQWSVSVFARGAGNESESLEAAGIAGVNRRWGPVGSEMGAGEARKVAVEATRETSREGEARESTASLKAIDGQAEGVDGGEEAEGEGIVGSVEGGGVKERGEGQGKGRESAGDAARGGEDSGSGGGGEGIGARGGEGGGKEERSSIGGVKGGELEGGSAEGSEGGSEEGGQEGEDLLVGCEEMMNEGLSDSSGGEEGGEEGGDKGGDKEKDERGEEGGEGGREDGGGKEMDGRGEGEGEKGGEEEGGQEGEDLWLGAVERGVQEEADAGGVRVGSNARDKRSGGRDESNSGGGSSGGSSGDSSGGAKGVVYGSEIGGARNGDGGGDAKGDSNGGMGGLLEGWPQQVVRGRREEGARRRFNWMILVPLTRYRAHGSPTPALLCSQATHAQHFPFPSPLSHCSPSHLLSGASRLRPLPWLVGPGHQPATLHQRHVSQHYSPPELPGQRRPDSQYERWQWRPEGAACALPRFDAEEFMRVYAR
ncbi:unnamed protein product [Closterium sp. NIES-65]|nr:unnamed protein product [Closterium sp. NIES-65]